ncbi:hypothetical protein BpHYR1_002019 [Brachionus plicatilis]|uniref:Uncharacterized protein n=1 Tax=Brachionus plicatilis TaxID=10195 RepID=A0A3M7QB40_BRAPC|nr:hypothetical protein BpHYR1_002019 [Brachionus plicatilis]
MIEIVVDGELYFAHGFDCVRLVTQSQVFEVFFEVLFDGVLSAQLPCALGSCSAWHLRLVCTAFRNLLGDMLTGPLESEADEEMGLEVRI